MNIPLCAVGRTPWSAVDPLVDLFRFWKTFRIPALSIPGCRVNSICAQPLGGRTRGSSADQGVRPTFQYTMGRSEKAAIAL